MAELGLVCNVVELTTTTISIIKQLLQAYDTLKKLPKQLEGNKRKLNELLETLEVVRDTKVLQTDRIADQIKAISETAGDVQARLKEAQKLQQKKVSRRYLRVLLSGLSDDKELFILFHRLDSARDELSLRIQIIHVTITGSMQESITHTMVEEKSQQPDPIKDTANRRRHKDENVLATTTKNTFAKQTEGSVEERNDTEQSSHKYDSITTTNTKHHAGDERNPLPEGYHHSNSNRQHVFKSINATGGILLTGDRLMGPDSKSVFD